MAYGNDLNSLIDGLVNYMVDGSPFATLAGEEMNSNMRNEMEDSMERLATPIHSHILSWWAGTGSGTFPDEMVKADSSDPTPGYLSTKVDNDTIKINSETHKLYIYSVPLATDVITGGIRIGAQDYLYINGSNLMVNVDTSNTLDGGNIKIPTSNAVKLYVDSVVSSGGSGGSGDMLKSTYDVTANGIVDDSEKLGTQLPSYYLDWDNFTNTPTSLSSYGISDAYTKTEIDSFFEAEVGGKKQILWSNVLTTPTSLVGYGISDAYTKTEIDGFFEPSVAGKKQIDWDNVINKPTVGPGDMLKSIYDTDDNGIVDDSEKLGTQLPSYYLDWDNFTNTPTTVAGYGITDTYTETEVDSFFEPTVSGKKQILWSNVLSTPTFLTLGSTGVGEGPIVMVTDTNEVSGSSYMSFALSTGLTISSYLNVSNRTVFGNDVRIASSKNIYFGSDAGGWDTYMGEISDDVLRFVANSTTMMTLNGTTQIASSGVTFEFSKLKLTGGLISNIETDNSADIYLTSSDYAMVFDGTYDLYLPSSPSTGQTFMVFNTGSSAVLINGNGNNISRGYAPNSQDQLNAYSGALYIYDGSVWRGL